MPQLSPEKTMLTEPEKTFLERLTARAKTEQRLALRANILLALDQNRSVSETARDLHIVRNTVKKWRDRYLAAQDQLRQAQQVPDSETEAGTFEALLVEVLSDAPRSGKPAEFTPEQITQIVALSCEDPAQSGRPVTNWTQRELADEAQKRGLVETISHRSVGRFLKRGGLETASESLLAQPGD